jgi:hypothetical protein
MVETGVEANGEITSEMDSSKKVVVTGLMPLTVNIFRKGSDPMAGMKM